MDLQADINSLLDQIAVEQIGIRDLAAMCLVVGVKHAGREEPLFREAYYQIIRTKSINYVQIMPPRLQIAFLLSLLVSRTPLMFFSRIPITSHQLVPTSLATLAPSLVSKLKVALAAPSTVLDTTLTTTPF